jgi:hypothetical protein
MSSCFTPQPRRHWRYAAHDWSKCMILAWPGPRLRQGNYLCLHSHRPKCWTSLTLMLSTTAAIIRVVKRRPSIIYCMMYILVGLLLRKYRSQALTRPHQCCIGQRTRIDLVPRCFLGGSLALVNQQKPPSLRIRHTAIAIPDSEVGRDEPAALG